MPQHNYVEANSTPLFPLKRFTFQNRIMRMYLYRFEDRMLLSMHRTECEGFDYNWDGGFEDPKMLRVDP